MVISNGSEHIPIFLKLVDQWWSMEIFWTTTRKELVFLAACSSQLEKRQYPQGGIIQNRSTLQTCKHGTPCVSWKPAFLNIGYPKTTCFSLWKATILGWFGVPYENFNWDMMPVGELPDHGIIYLFWLVVSIIFYFPYIGDNHPNWLIFFRGGETTNQCWLLAVKHM